MDTCFGNLKLDRLPTGLSLFTERRVETILSASVLVLLVCVLPREAQAGKPLAWSILDKQVYDVVIKNGEFWLATEAAIYRLGEDGDLAVVRHGRSNLIDASDESPVWAWTGAGLGWLEDSGQLNRLGLEEFTERRIRGIEVFGRDGPVWIGTPVGLYSILIIEGTLKISGFEEHRDVRRLMKFGKTNLYAVTGKEILRTNATDPEPSVERFWSLPDRGLVIKKVLLDENSGSAWVTTLDGLGQPGKSYQVPIDGSPPSLLAISEDLRVNTIAVCGGEVLLGTRDGLHSFTKGSPVPGFPVEAISLVSCVERDAWLATSNAVYRRAGQSGMIQLIIKEQEDLGVEAFVAHNKRTWFWGRRGFYKVESDVQVDLKTSIIPVAPSVGLSLSDTVYVREVTYLNENGDALIDAPQDLEVFLGMSPSDLEKAIQDKVDIPRGEDIGRKIPVGLPSIYFSVRDSNGVERHKESYGWVISLDPVLSPLLSLGVATVVIGWVFGLFSVILAPYHLAAMLVVDSSFFRHKATFGLISFALLWGRLRRHILRRYLKNLVNELKTRLDREPDERRQTPSVADVVRALSRGGGTIVINCRNGNRAIFDRLALTFCGGCNEDDLAEIQEADAGQSRLRWAIPVSLSLPVYLMKDNEDPGVDDLTKGVLGEFANFGDINDPQLGRYLLDQGNFIFFLRDYHELDDPCRYVVQQFINRYERENSVIISWNEKLMAEAENRTGARSARKVAGVRPEEWEVL